MFGADTVALFAKYCLKFDFTCLNKYFQKDKKVNFLSALASSFKLPLTIFCLFLVFVTNYPTSCQLLMDIIFGYPLIGQFDTI